MVFFVWSQVITEGLTMLYDHYNCLRPPSGTVDFCKISLNIRNKPHLYSKYVDIYNIGDILHFKNAVSILRLL